jgi:hypothetical protein
MNSRGFLLFRMLIELLICLAFGIASIDTERVRISSLIWVDVPCRLVFAIIAIAIFTNVITLYRDYLAARN